MRKYLRYSAMTWQTAMTFRANSWLESAGTLLTMLISISLWLFAFSHTGKGTIANYTKNQMVFYLIVAGFIASNIYFTAQGDKLISLIRTGKVARYLVRPVNLMMVNFSRIISWKVFNFISSIFGITLIVTLFRINIEFPTSIASVLIFIPFFIFAIIIHFLIFYTIAMVAFWMDEVWGISFVVRVFAEVAAGTFIPLTLFAPGWQRLFNLLPFKFIVSVPVNVLMGRMQYFEIFSNLAGALFWILLLAGCATLLMHRGLKHFSAVGG